MKNKISKIICGLLLSTILVFSFSTTVYALGEYTTLAPLPGTTDCGNNPGAGASCKTDIKTYLPSFINLAIGIAAVMAFVMITFGGITYATTDSVFGKADGKKFVTDAIYGLLLVLGAWAILNTLNPNILKFTLSLPKPYIETAQPGGTPTGSGLCANCQTLASANLPTSGSAVGKSVSPTLLPKLSTLSGLLSAAGVPWVITEAYPPSVTHVASCHQDGTCVDARPTNQTPTNINSFYNAAKAAGLRPEYEVKTQAEKDSLVAKGVTAYIIVVKEITGPHFSVYRQ